MNQVKPAKTGMMSIRKAGKILIPKIDAPRRNTMEHYEQ
jgi:hypothetical protein